MKILLPVFSLAMTKHFFLLVLPPLDVAEAARKMRIQDGGKTRSGVRSNDDSRREDHQKQERWEMNRSMYLADEIINHKRLAELNLHKWGWLERTSWWRLEPLSSMDESRLELWVFKLQKKKLKLKVKFSKFLILSETTLERGASCPLYL